MSVEVLLTVFHPPLVLTHPLERYIDNVRHCCKPTHLGKQLQ